MAVCSPEQSGKQDLSSNGEGYNSSGEPMDEEAPPEAPSPTPPTAPDNRNEPLVALDRPLLQPHAAKPSSPLQEVVAKPPAHQIPLLGAE